MSRGNKEIRFRASPETHSIIEKISKITCLDKAGSSKLLISLGNNKIEEAINYFHGLTHPLNETQYNDFFSALKVLVSDRRRDGKK